MNRRIYKKPTIEKLELTENVIMASGADYVYINGNYILDNWG